jgi:hypothetical protein
MRPRGHTSAWGTSLTNRRTGRVRDDSDRLVDVPYGFRGWVASSTMRIPLSVSPYNSWAG